MHQASLVCPSCPPAVSIYTMKDTKSSARGVQLLHTMPSKQCTSLHWSPAGRFLLLAGLEVSPRSAARRHDRAALLPSARR
jgi:hypothetical protein